MSNTLRKEPRPIPSDATLVWLASERAAPLFRTLDRTKAFGPLVVVLATLPSMLAIFGETVTVEDAGWGLRALDAVGVPMPLGTSSSVEAVVPSDVVRPLPLWISGWLMRLTGPAAPMSGSFASLIGGTLLLGLFWPLARSLSGRRLAFWAVLLAAFHPTLVELLRFPAPVTVGLAASVAAFWASLNLDGKPARAALTWGGTVAAILLALSVSGLVALAVPVVIAVDALFAWILSGNGAGAQTAGRGKVAPVELAVRRISAAAVGAGIWTAVAAAGLGSVEEIVPVVEAPIDDAVDAGDEDRSAMLGPLWGLAVIGVGRMLRVVHRRATSRSARPVPRLILVWLIAASGLILWRGGTSEIGFDPAGRFVQGLASLSVLLAAAYAIEEASRRTVSGAWVLLAVALPLAVRLGTFMATVRTEGPWAWALVAVAGFVVLWLVTKVIPAAVPMAGLRRGMLMTAILFAIAVDGADGAAVLLGGAPEDDHYRIVTARLRAIGPAEQTLIIAESPPLRLVFAVRASFPSAEMRLAPSWVESAAAFGHEPRPFEIATVAVSWGVPEDGGGARENLQAKGEPLLYEDRELLIYASTRG